MDPYIVKYHNSNSWNDHCNDESIKFATLLVRILKLSALEALSKKFATSGSQGMYFCSTQRKSLHLGNL